MHRMSAGITSKIIVWIGSTLFLYPHGGVGDCVSPRTLRLLCSTATPVSDVRSRGDEFLSLPTSESDSLFVSETRGVDIYV